MELPTIKTSGEPRLDQIRLLLYGQPKIGKTSLAASFPNALFLATEKGYTAQKVYPIDIVGWTNEFITQKNISKTKTKGVEQSGFVEAVDEILKGRHKFQTIVIDTVDILFNHCHDYICKKFKVQHATDLAYGKGWAIIKKEFEIQINRLFYSDYALIFISHTKTVDINTRTIQLSKTVPTLANQGIEVLEGKVSLIGHLDIKSVKNKEGKYVERRVLSFEHSETLKAGDRDGKMPPEIFLYKDGAKNYAQFVQAYARKGGEGK